MLTKREALDRAHALAARMGEGWESCVWENSGWHYTIKKGCVTIYPGHGDPVDYSAWIEPPNVLIGRTQLQIIARGPTPEDALGNAVQDARTVMSRLTEALDQLREVV